MAGDSKRLAWIRRQPCAVCEAPPPSHAHHHTTGRTVASRGGRQPSGLRRGVGQKADDTETLPLCIKDHAALHDLRGFFSGYTAGELREWQDKQVAHYQAMYEAELAELNAPAGAALAGRPVPSMVDDFDIGTAADAFLAEYPS